jgi:hypothetical protein
MFDQAPFECRVDGDNMELDNPLIAAILRLLWMYLVFLQQW